MSDWEAVIGLEIHVQLATESKLFSPSAIRFGEEANRLLDPVVLGLPGALPTLNRAALELGLVLATACESQIRQTCRFARKHYFYPDLPKGYQISQAEQPLAEGGHLDYIHGGELRSLRLIRIHLEEDAGKSTHRGRGSSLVDLNRAGVPLCEIVSEPELRSASEAAAAMRALRQLVRWLGISEGDMEKGQLRCDANVSLRRRGDESLGVRTELKNINSFKFVEQAIDHELRRQLAVLEEGGTVAQETRLWDSDARISRVMRGKEDAGDYRYFPDPDLPPLELGDEQLSRVAATLPELPLAARARLIDQFSLTEDDAAVLTGSRALTEYFDAAVAAAGPEAARTLAHWIQSELLRELKDAEVEVEASPVTPAALAELVVLIEKGTISGKIAKRVFAEMAASGGGAEEIVEREGWAQLADPAAIEVLVDEVLAAHPAQRDDYRAGRENLLGFFVGKVMAASSGRAHPELVNKLLRAKLAASSAPR